MSANGPGSKPFLNSKNELTVGSQVIASESSRLSGQDVRVKSKAKIYGTLDYENLKADRKSEIANPNEITETSEFGMDQNYPNPFNPTTLISYTLAEVSDVKLVVYNILGKEVRILVNNMQAMGSHSIQWDGRDAIGRKVSSGMYIYRLVAGQNVAIKKMIFAK